MKYLMLYQSCDGPRIVTFPDDKALSQGLNAHMESYPDSEPQSEVPALMDGAFSKQLAKGHGYLSEGDFVVVRGEVVVPEPEEIITRWKV